MRRLRELLGVAFSGLTSRKVRTLLIMLGPVLGVASIVAAIGINESSKGHLKAKLQELGTDLIVVNASSGLGFGQDPVIEAAAVARVRRLPDVVAVTGTSVTGQNMTIDQRSTGGIIDSGVSANAGNSWDLAGRANAGANRVVLSNQGGSVVATTRQDNSSQIQSQAIVTSYDYGAATSYARGVANEVSVGNNDIYVEIDNAQINTGGVAVNAQVSGTQGYDAYVGADAAGNVVTGFACADCAGYIDATNTQSNSGNVSATAQTTINGTNRAVITGTNAVGNAATFYVSRSGN